jgi:integrase
VPYTDVDCGGLEMASIERRPDGRWRARWREYPAGPQRTKHFPRKLDAEKYLVRIQHDLLTGAYVDPAKGRTTVEDYYAVWEARQPWRAATRNAVRSSFRGHVVPAFGKRPLGSVRRGDIESWAAGLSLSASSAGLAVQHLGTMFESAVADGLIATNPVRRAKRPRVDVEPVVPFSSEQLTALSAASPGWFRVALTLGTACGLRQGEATGLTLDRIDFLRRQLTVDRQLVSPPSGPPVFAPPKTPRSYRSVPLADVAIEALSAHIDENGTGQHGVLLHRKGRPLTRPRFGEIWREIRTQAAMPAARFHDTRHTYASILLSGGVSVAAAADYLGHSPAELLKTYAHMVPADHDRARSVVQAAFAKAAAGASARTAED